MAKIYLPIEYMNKPCYQVNNGYIRVFNTIQNNNSNVVYDIYINQDYQVRQGTATYNSSSTICDTVNSYTSDWWYRVDIVNYFLIMSVLSIFLLWIPYHFVIKSFFRRLRI